jgi:hypothetical protein
MEVMDHKEDRKTHYETFGKLLPGPQAYKNLARIVDHLAINITHGSAKLQNKINEISRQGAEHVDMDQFSVFFKILKRF